MAIQLPDARSLRDEILEALRLRALRARELGLTEGVIAAILGVSRETVSRWCVAVERGGPEALPQHRSGRPPGPGRTLDDQQARRIQAVLDQQTPEQVGIAAPLWTRRAVAELIRQELGITLPVRTVGEYLRRWGYTPKRPARKARKRDPGAIRRWLEQTDPRVVARAKAEGAEISWCDEMGVGIDEYPGRGYARKGQPAVKEVAGARTRVNVVSAMTNSGEVHFQAYSGTMDGRRFLGFLGQLVEEATGKIFLVLDNLKVHECAEVQEWVAARRERIELIPLPKYAPEFNPVEDLNHDTKAQVNAEGLPKTQKELKSNLEKFLDKLAGLPERIMNYFCHPSVRYAAADAM